MKGHPAKNTVIITVIQLQQVINHLLRMPEQIKQLLYQPIQ